MENVSAVTTTIRDSQFIEYFSDQSSESDGENVDEVVNTTLRQDLAAWCSQKNITHTATTDLFRVLKGRVTEELPGCARTLLSTPRHALVLSKAGGDYKYFDLKVNIVSRIAAGLKDRNSNLLSLTVGCDGLAACKSSNRQIWPIMCIVNESKNASPFVAAIFSGMNKPASLADYLQDFVQELGEILELGLKVGDRMYCIRVSHFAADAPARSFLKGCVQHNSYFACEKCSVEGTWKGRVVYNDIDRPLRTDESFKNREQEEHHKVSSPLEDIIGIGMV